MTTQQAIPSLEDAYAAFTNGNAAFALEQIELILQSWPNNFDALNAAGIVAFQLGKQEKAIIYLKDALLLQPSNAVCAQNLAGILLQQGRFQEISDILGATLRFHSTNTELRNIYNTALQRLKLQRLPMAVMSRIDMYNRPPNERQRDGDHWFGLHLKRALAACGLPINRQDSKLFLLLHGAMPARVNPQMYNMIWIHSHPHTLTREGLEMFDKVFCLSPIFTNRLKTAGLECVPLVGGTSMQTTPTRSAPQHGIVFVGNARKISTKPASRPVIDLLLSLGEKWVSKLEIWGQGWEGIVPEHCIKGQVFDNSRLAQLYGSSTVVLNDHHEDMRVEGFINPRILDVMGAGGVVISDDLRGHQDLFKDALTTFSTAEELDTHLARCFDDPDYRYELALKGKQAVTKYTFSHVAQQLIQHILTIDEEELASRSRRRRTHGSTQGSEGWITFSENRVTKKYKPAYHVYNQGYNRRGEAYYLKNFPSPYFAQLIEASDTQLILKHAGYPIGRNDSSSPRKRVLEPNGLNLVGLVQWLKGLKTELQHLGLKHRDINPTNILYDEETDQYTLIDFGWMIKDDDPDGPDTHPATLNPYASSDAEAIQQLIHDAIHAQIARINKGKHYDGSSTRSGWVYHPIAFEEFSAPVHKTAAIDELQEVIRYCRIPERTNHKVLEIGSSVGYFAFNLAARGCRVTAYEADPEAYGTAEAMRIYKDIDNIQFINRPFAADALEALKTPYDLTLMLNVHMWIHKFLGPQKTIELMQQLSRKTKQLIFQTAHAESGGMYLVKELKNADDIKAYLETCGFVNVQHIRDTDAHNGIRSLFLCEGQA